MKIMICGSMTFSKEMLETQRQLIDAGHDAWVPDDAEHHVREPGFIDDFEKDRLYCIETDIMRVCMKKVEEADAVLVLNYPKNGVDGYIGTAALMELGLAHYRNKQIFLLYPTPSPADARWAHEVSIFEPTIIHGDLSKVC